MGNTWVAGYTGSSDFPILGGFDASLGGSIDAFVARISAAGVLAFSSYLGGSGDDFGTAIDIDASGNAWIAGRTQSADFPTTGGFDTALGAPEDAFVAKVSQAGALLFASYLGGGASDGGQAIAVDASGNAWVAGYTSASDFPTPGGFDTSLAGGDAFVARITPAGVLAWGSFLGGFTADYGNAIAVDASCDAWIAGTTRSSDFPTTGGFDRGIGGSQDGFVARITKAGTLAEASFLGGSGDDAVNGISIDASGNVWLAGVTASADMAVPGGFDASYGGAIDGFVATVLPGDAGWHENVSWLTIDKLQITLSPTPGNDTLTIRGSCSMWLTGNVPPAITLNVDSWAAYMDPSQWKGANSTSFSYNDGFVSGKVVYRVGRTTRCNFTITAKGQMLQGNLPSMPSLPVRLRFGSHFDQTLTANVTLSGSVAKLSSAGPPAFFVDKLQATRSASQSSHDSAKLTGRLFLESDFNPAADEIAMSIGPYAFAIPAGTMPAATNGVIKYSTPTANGTLTFQLNLKTHVLTMTATGIDLSALVPETSVSLSVTNHAGAAWTYSLLLAGNKAGTSYKY